MIIETKYSIRKFLNELTEKKQCKFALSSEFKTFVHLFAGIH